MALQTSGKISILDIVGEFGGSAPHSISEYYSAASGVPGSGEISLSDFYGTSSVFTATISSNQTNLNLRSFALNSGWDGSTVAEITIDSGVVVSGSAQSNSTAALTIDGSWPNGVTLINQGIIQGRGGNGGAGGDANVDVDFAEDGSSGSAGGRALLVSTPVSIQNNGSVRGGGGGGGGGGGAGFDRSNVYDDDETGGGGGGGGGRSSLISSSGGAGGDAIDGDVLIDGSPGQNGTISSAGSGGSGAIGEDVIAGDGGNGASFGSSGASGGSSTATGPGDNTPSTASGGSGGAAGQAVSGNSNITWITTGTRIGPIV